MGAGIEKLQLGSGGTSIQLSQQVLRTDASGMPLEWIDYKEAVRLPIQKSAPSGPAISSPKYAPTLFPKARWKPCRYTYAI